MFQYSGINGGYSVKNAPLPLKELFKSKDRSMFDMHITDGIKTLEEFVNNNSNAQYGRDLTWAASMIYKMTGIQCYSILQIVPKNILQGIINSIKTILLKIFIQLDKSYGCLDALDIDTSNKPPDEIAKINTVVNNYFLEDNSIQLGDKNKIDGTEIFTGRKL